MRLGRQRKAIMATQTPMARASLRSQWPMRTQLKTSMMNRENDSNSAAVKRLYSEVSRVLLNTSILREEKQKLLLQGPLYIS